MENFVNSEKRAKSDKLKTHFFDELILKKESVIAARIFSFKKEDKRLKTRYTFVY